MVASSYGAAGNGNGNSSTGASHKKDADNNSSKSMNRSHSNVLEGSPRTKQRDIENEDGFVSLRRIKSEQYMRTIEAASNTNTANGATTTRRAALYDNAEAMDRMRASMLGDNQAFKSLKYMGITNPEENNYKFGSDSERNSSSAADTAAAKSPLQLLSSAASQLPAIILIGMFHLMIGIPFGVSYFPIGWTAAEADTETTDDLVHGDFPIPGKEALGIRMFLFATMIGQVVFTLQSGFKNPIGLQMVENVPFCHALSQLVIKHQGYGVNALSTILILFGMSSVIVGTVFMILGQLNLGRVVYYFPNHVLVGCIAGIGVFLAKTGIEVTINAVFANALTNMDLVAVVIFFETALRILDRVLRDKDGRPLYALLSPIYFCMITPFFYLGLWAFSISVDDATTMGYFFPSLQGDDSSIWNEDLLDMWRFIDFSTITWAVIVDSVPTMIALVLFSLIHVPINIPAFALSTNTEVDMNTELIAHGYSNLLSGFCGGLQNYLAYTQSVIYDKSGGTGKPSGLCVAVVTAALYVVGPTVGSYIPRCMAGTLLLHVGIDLFLEGVYDSYSRFDRLEYGSVLIIIVVMTLYGMDAAMMVGVLSAVTVFVTQNMAYIDPVRGTMSAETLRSDERNRSHKARALLDAPSTGRSRILVIQLQGHLFFGNIAGLSKKVHELMSERFGTIHQPVIVILDFSLVLGIDSSAAQAVVKFKTVMRKQFDVTLSIFVSGSPNGFPCAFDLSAELAAALSTRSRNTDLTDESTGLLHRVSSHDAVEAMIYSGSHVSEDLNLALIYAENSLIARQNTDLLVDDVTTGYKLLQKSSSLSEESEVAEKYLLNLCPSDSDERNARVLFSKFRREVYVRGDYLWKQGSPSLSIKLLVRGMLISILENEAGTNETVSVGNIIGELGVIEGVARMSSVSCCSEEAVVYSLSLEAYHNLQKASPEAARLVDLICIRYLSARVQHVSNRIFETRCLPI